MLASAAQMSKRLVFLLGASVALVPIVAASAATPANRTFEPGKALAGVSLGMSKDQVLGIWAERHGVCRFCPHETWYFNYEPFNPQGVGVVFRRGHVAQLFTVWRPAGWKTTRGLALGAPVSDVSRLYGSLDRRQCTLYYALLKPAKRAVSVFYVFSEEVWGFGLIRPNASPCL
jgi:hypothetical protein